MHSALRRTLSDLRADLDAKSASKGLSKSKKSKGSTGKSGRRGSVSKEDPVGSPLPHLHRDRARPCHICTGTGLTPPTSPPGRGSPLPHRDLGSRAGLHRDWFRPSPRLRRDCGSPLHICARIPRRTPPTHLPERRAPKTRVRTRAETRGAAGASPRAAETAAATLATAVTSRRRKGAGCTVRLGRGRRRMRGLGPSLALPLGLAA